jgi:hypothetical protein
MGKSIWERIIEFVYLCYTKYIKQVGSGLIMGGIGGYNISFAGIPPELAHSWIGIWAWIKTVFFAFSSSLATGYAALLIERHKEKKNPRNDTRLKRKNRAA